MTMGEIDVLPEDGLLQLHFTHPKEMDGSSRLKQHDNVHKQITAFEKILQHAINRFSTHKLHQMLRLITRGLPAIPKAPHTKLSKPADEIHDDISSLSQLREVIVQIRDPKKKGIEKEEETHVIKYFETFLEDIAYLKSLKRYFDEKVYICLYDYFYDPEDDMLDPREVLKREKKGRVTFEEEKDSGNSSFHESDEEPFVSVEELDESTAEAELEFYFDRLYDNEKLSVAVRKMFQLNGRWDMLFDEEEINHKWFDSDSKHEILQYDDFEQFELILRLVPDIFVKAYKSVELAKMWWIQANKIYPVLPQAHTRRHTDKDIAHKMENWEKKLSSLKTEIRTNEELLVRQKEDLRHLHDRETRYKYLSEQCEKLEERKNHIGERYNEILEERDDIKQTLQKLTPHSDRYVRKQAVLRKCEHQFFDAQVELRMISFQFQLIQGDFLVELGLRPDIIRFQVDAQTKIEETEDIIQNRKKEVRIHEKKLVLLRTNCDRMRKIMRKYLNSEDENIAKPPEGRKYKKKSNSDRKSDSNVHNSKSKNSDFENVSGRDQGKIEEKSHNRKPSDGGSKSHDKKSKTHKNSKNDDKVTPDEDIDDGNVADTDSPLPRHNKPKDHSKTSRGGVAYSLDFKKI